MKNGRGPAVASRGAEGTTRIEVETGASAVPTAPHASGLERRALLDLYYYMLLGRRLEERLVGLLRQGKLVGGLYRSLGQEATAVGPAYALRAGDLYGPLIRDLGGVLTRGYAPREIFAQYLAREAGPTRGRDGVLHFGDVEGRGVIPAVCMLGDLVSVLAGAGMAFGMTGRRNVCLTHVGDGGTSTGAFHEGLNFAAVRRLPVVVVIENNGYAYSTPVAKQTRQPDFSRRGPAYGVPGVKVDGNDVLAVHEAAALAIERARDGGGPTVIEAETFRMEGHAQHDDAIYVPRALLEEWKERDPIARYEARLLADGVVTTREIRTIAAGIEAQLDEDQKWAEDAPFPSPESGLSGVTADAAASPRRGAIDLLCRPPSGETGEPG